MCGYSAYDWKTIATSRAPGATLLTTRSPIRIRPSVTSSRPGEHAQRRRLAAARRADEHEELAVARSRCVRSSTATVSSKRLVTCSNVIVGHQAASSGSGRSAKCAAARNEYAIGERQERHHARRRSPATLTSRSARPSTSVAPGRARRAGARLARARPRAAGPARRSPASRRRARRARAARAR